MSGKTTDFNNKGCQSYNAKGKLLAVGMKTGRLLYLYCSTCNNIVNVQIRKDLTLSFRAPWIA